jgi:signal transduction histidine kinase
MSIARWLRENEKHIVPAWIKLVRSRGGERDRQLTTRELERQFFIDFYFALVQGIESENEAQLADVIERIAVTRVGQEFLLEETLYIFFLLKELIWQRLAEEHAPDVALSWITFLEPFFDRSLALLGRNFTGASRKLLSERLVDAEFMTRRLSSATEEADRALSRLRILYNISRAISSTLDLKQILMAVVENLGSLPQIDRCAVWLVDQSGLELSVAVTHGIEAQDLGGAYLVLEEDGSAIARAFTSGKMQMTSRLDEEEEYLIRFFARRTLLAVPLAGEDRPLGVITVDRVGQDRAFETAVIDMVQAVADQAAVALRNTQLYEEVVQFNQQLERRVQERTEELGRLNRDLAILNKKKSDFIAIAAHELKTPLTLIQGYAEMLVEERVQDLPADALDRLANGIVKGTNRLKTIIEDIIDVSLIDTEVLSLNFQPSSVYGIVELACRDWQESAAERNQTLSLSNFDHLPFIEADALRLHQVFGNIIGNAVKYTPDGGRIEIAAREWQGRDDTVYVEVVIADTGVGIDLEEQERIFDKFYRIESPDFHSSSKTKFLGAGPGLGLTIAKGIVEAHGGRIWVESSGFDLETCPGSHFHVVLPTRTAWGDFQGELAAEPQSLPVGEA